MAELAVARGLPLNLDSGFYPLQFLADSRALRRYVKDRKVDLVHCHRGQDHWLAAMALLGRGMPTLTRTRHVVSRTASNPPNRWLYRRTRGTIATCSVIRKQLAADGLKPAEEIHTLHGGVDTERFHPDLSRNKFREELGIDNETFLIGAVGHLDPVKGFDRLLHACTVLRFKHARFFIVIVGGKGKLSADALQRDAYEAEVRDHVRFTGYRKDIPNIMAALDVGVISSVGSEGNSRVALEFMASGKPVVATSVGSLPDLVLHEKTGLLVSPLDLEELSQALLQLAGNPQLRSAMGQAARNHVEARYAWPRVAAEVVDIYREALRPI